MPLNDPIPSNAPDVLLRNAQDFDKLINSSGNHTNRVGNSLPSYITAIAELGFDAPVLFASGIVVDSSRKTVEYSGARYFAKPSAVPFTTTGIFNPAQWQMFDQQFAGAEIAQIGTYSLLRAYAGAATLVYVAGRSHDQDGAAGVFAVDEADTTSADNDGTILVDSIGRRWKRQHKGAVNVAWFGAVGDGVNDDTVAIQAAIDWAGFINGTIIVNKVNTVRASAYLPSGTYKTSAVLNIGEATTLEGDSSSSTIIKPTHTGTCINMGSSSREYSQIKVKNIGIVGNRSGTLSYGLWTTTTTIGIYVENCIRECYIENCFITQCETSIKAENSYAFEINSNYLVYAKTNHIEWDNAVAGVIRNNRIDWAEHTGIYMNGTNAGDETIGLLIESNAIQICWRDAIKLLDVSSCTINANFFEANYREAVDGTTHVYADINIVSGANNRGYSFVVTGNFFTHGSSPNVDAYTAIRCDRAQALTVIGNNCRDSYYWRLIDANSPNVKRIVSLGNTFAGTFTNTAYDPTVTTGIIEEQAGDGVLTLPQAQLGGMLLRSTVSGSTQTSSGLQSAYLISTASGVRNFNLRDADCLAGRVYIIKKTSADANALQVQREGGSTKTIDGVALVSTTSAYGVIRIISDGSNWFTI